MQNLIFDQNSGQHLVTNKALGLVHLNNFNNVLGILSSLSDYVGNISHVLAMTVPWQLVTREEFNGHQQPIEK